MRKAVIALLVFVGAVWAWAQGPVVAVAPFVVRAGLIGADFGLAEMLEKKLQDAGFSVLPARALESWRLGQGIPFRDETTWKTGAQILGANCLLLGTLESLNTARITIGLGPLAIQAVSAEASFPCACSTWTKMLWWPRFRPWARDRGKQPWRSNSSLPSRGMCVWAAFARIKPCITRGSPCSSAISILLLRTASTW